MSQACVKVQSVAWQELFELEGVGGAIGRTWKSREGLWSPSTCSQARLAAADCVSGQKRCRFLTREVYVGKERETVSGREKHVSQGSVWLALAFDIGRDDRLASITKRRILSRNTPINNPIKHPVS